MRWLGRERSERRIRLETTHRLYGAYSQVRLVGHGLGPGSVCLEAGVGEGSMLRWLAEQAGPAGRVIGVDLDDRFFARNEGPNVELQCADIRDIEVAPRSVDFIHARNFLMFIPDTRALLGRFYDWLRPGGVVVLSEIDFRFPVVASGVGQVYNRLCEAFVRRVAERGGDATLGTRLHEVLRSVGFERVDASGDFPIVVPGGDAAQLMSLNVETLQLLMNDPPDAPEVYEELIAELPRGEVVRTCHTQTTTWGQRPV